MKSRKFSFFPLPAADALRQSRTFTIALSASAAMVALSGCLHAQTIAGTGYKGVTNNGTANTANWSTPTNWDSTGPAANERNLFFGQGYKAAAGTNFISNNDIAGFNGYRITFQDSNATGTSTDGSAANDTAFTITGNGFSLFDFGAGNFPRIQNDSYLTQTFSLTSGETIVLSGGSNNKAEINAINGDLTFSSGTKIDLAGTTQLQIFGNNGKNLTFNDVISSSGNGGANSVAINQNSTVIYGAANTYSGDTFVNAGKLQFNTGGSANNSTIRIGDSAATAVNAEVDLLPLTGGLTLSSVFNTRTGNTGTAIIDSRNTSGTNTLSNQIALDKALTITESGAIGTGTLAITQARAGGVGTTTGTDIKGFALTLNVANLGNAINYSGDIYNSTGGGGVTKTGLGLLTLSGINTYTGNTTISAGIVRLGGGAAIANAGVVSIATGGLLDLNGTTETVGSVSGASGAINLGTSGSLILSDNNASSITGLVYGTGGSLVKNGTGTLTLGTIQGSSNSFASGNLFSGGITIASGSGLTTISTANASGTGLINTASSLTISQAQYLLAGGITINGGTTTLSNSFAGGTGTVTLNTGGGLNVTSANALQLNSLNLAGGTFTINTSIGGNSPNFTSSASIGALSGSVNIAVPIAFTTSASIFTLTLGTNNASPSAYTGTILNPAGGAGPGITSLIKVGSGTQILNGISTNSGTITANGSGGTLEIGGQFSGNGAIAVNSGTLKLNFGTSNLLTTDLVKSAGLTLGGGTLAVIGRTDATNANQNFTTTTFGTGTASNVSVGNGAGGGTTALNLGSLTRNAGSAVNFNLPSGTQSTNNSILTSSPSGGGGALLVPTNNTAYATVGGTGFAAKDATNAFILALTGSVTATGGASFTGTTTHNADINGVNVSVLGTSTINTVRFNDTAARTVTLGGALTVTAGGILVSNSVVSAGSGITGSTITSGGTAELIVHQFSAQPFTIGSQIIGSNPLTKTGTGTLILTGNNTLSGNTYVASGTLQIGTGGSLGSSTINMATNDPTAVFDVNNQTTSVGGLNGGSATGGYVTLGSKSVLTITGNGGTLNSSLVGGVDSVITKNASGTFGLQASNLAFYGTINLTASGAGLGTFNSTAANLSNVTLNLTHASSLLTSGGGFITSYLLGNLNGAGSIDGGSVSAQAETVGVGFLGASGSFSGVVKNGTGSPTPGVVSFTKFGSGAQTLSGNNIYTGTTQVNTGGLIFDYSTGSTTPLATTGSLLVGGGTVTFKGLAAGGTTATTGAFGVNNSALSKVVLDNNGAAAGITANLKTTTVNGVTTLASTTVNNNVLFDTSSISANLLRTDVAIGAAGFTASDTIGIRTNNGILTTGLTSNTGYRANILIKDSTGIGFATTSGTSIVRYTGATALTAADTTTTLVETGAGNYKLSVNLTRGASNQFLYNTIELDSSTQAVTLTTDSNGNRFGGGGGNTTSGRGVLATGTNGATITSLGGTNQATYFNNYQTGGTTAGQTLTLNMPLGGVSYFNGTGLIVATGTVGSNDQWFQSGVTRLTGAQVSGDALTAGNGVYRLVGGVMEIGADLTSNISPTSTADFSRSVGTAAGQVQLLGDTGFSAFGANRTVNLGANGQQLLWGTDSFLASTSSGTVEGNNTFKLSSTYSDSRIDFQNAIALGSITRQVDVANGSAAVDARLSGIISGVFAPTVTLANLAPAVVNAAAGLTKLGTGTLELTAANTYKGRTTVAAGTLLVNNLTGSGTGTGEVVVSSGGKLAGSGTIGGSTTIQSGGILAAGNNGVGTQTFSSSLTYSSGSIFEWDLAANKDTDGLDNIASTADDGVRGTDYDAVNVTGNLTIDSAAIFKVIQNAGTSFGDVFWTTNQNWSNIFNVTGTTLSGWSNTAVSVYNTSNVLQDVSSIGSFTITGSTLSWSAVPEPTSALAGLLLGAGLLRRRRVA